MADVSKIKVPNGTVYDLKDETARVGLAGKADANHTHSEYASKSKYEDKAISVGRKANTTVGLYSSAVGQATTASGHSSHAEGINTTASGDFSHAEGSNTTASGDFSHAGGHLTNALHDYEVAYGVCNISRNDTLFSIGDGSDLNNRHNAFEITTTGGKLHDKDIATTDLIPTELPANGGNADTLDGHHADDFAKYNNPSIEGQIFLVRAGNATTADSIFAWEDTLRLRNQDPNAENTTYTDLLLTPSGIFTEGLQNGTYTARHQIYGGRPYIMGIATNVVNGIMHSNEYYSYHGFMPSAVFYIVQSQMTDGHDKIYPAKSFDTEKFITPSIIADNGNNLDQIKYIMLK